MTTILFITSYPFIDKPKTHISCVKVIEALGNYEQGTIFSLVNRQTCAVGERRNCVVDVTSVAVPIAELWIYREKPLTACKTGETCSGCRIREGRISQACSKYILP